MRSRKWQFGDVYYQASGEVRGEPQDLGDHGGQCHTKAEAEENARDWLCSLPERERRSATAWVRGYRVIVATEDGPIKSACRDGAGAHVEA